MFMVAAPPIHQVTENLVLFIVMYLLYNVIKGNKENTIKEIYGKYFLEIFRICFELFLLIEIWNL